MIIKNGQTDVTTYFVLRDSTNHEPALSVTITDIDVYYVKEMNAISSKADLTALAAADSAHADNKGFEIGQGVYRIDWPDIFDGGVGTKVILIVVCSGYDTTFLEIELSPATDIRAVDGSVDALTGLKNIGLTALSGAVVDDAGNSSTVFKTNLTEAQDNYYNDGVIVFIDGTTNEYQSRRILDYDGTDKIITVGPAFDAEPAENDIFIILGRIEGA